MKIINTSLLVLLTVTNMALANNLSQVRVKALPGTVALTFDDGPSPIYTPQILDILRKHHINATFFVMGWAAKKYPGLIKRMMADGDAVAIHTMTHPMLTKLSKKRLSFEVVEPKKIVTQILGKRPMCLRPPYGVSNARVRQFVRSQGMVPVAMGFNSFDYKRPGTLKLARWVIKNARSGRVFLLHDGYKARSQTVAALPKIIAGIRAKGLGFSVICENQG